MPVEPPPHMNVSDFSNADRQFAHTNQVRTSAPLSTAERVLLNHTKIGESHSADVREDHDSMVVMVRYF